MYKHNKFRLTPRELHPALQVINAERNSPETKEKHAIIFFVVRHNALIFPAEW